MNTIIIIDTSILYKGPWKEFENNFEEGWTGEPGVFTLANREHHIAVSAYAAKQLSNQYKSEGEIWAKHKAKAQSIIQEAYNNAAAYLYPEDKLWEGTESENPEFWAERDNSTTKQENHIK